MRRSKNLLYLAWNSFFTDLSSEMIIPLFPIFMKSLGSSSSFLGFVEGLAEFFAKFFPLIIGHLIEKTKKIKPFVVFGYFVSNITKPFLGFVYNIYLAASIRWIDRVGKGIRGTPRDLLISYASDDEKKGKYFTFQKQFDKGGAIIGAITSLILLNLFHVNIRIIFLLSLIPALFSIYLLVFKIKEPNNVKFKHEKIDFRLILIFPKVYLRIFLVGFILIGYGLFFSKFFTYNEAPLAYLFLNFSGLLVFHYLRNLSDKFSKKLQIKYIFLLFSIFYMIFMWVNNPVFAYLMIFFYGALMNYSQILLISNAAEVKEHTAIVLGLTYFIMGVASIFGNSIFGFLMDFFDFSIASLSFAIISFFGFVLS